MNKRYYKSKYFILQPMKQSEPVEYTSMRILDSDMNIVAVCDYVNIGKNVRVDFSIIHGLYETRLYSAVWEDMEYDKEFNTIYSKEIRK